MDDHLSAVGRWLGGSWMMAAATWVSDTHLALSIIATVAAVAASVVTVAMQIEARKARQAEARKAQAEEVVAWQKLCRGCQAGDLPAHCPLPEGERP